MEQRSMSEELSSRITALIDGALSDEERRLTLDMMDSSPQLQQQYQTESALTSMLRARRDRLRTALPPAVERRVRMAVNAQAMPRPSLLERFAAPRGWQFVRIFAAGAAVVLLAVFVYNGGSLLPTQAPQSVAAMPPVDIPSQAYSNYASVMSGALTLGLQTSNATELASYFRAKGVQYDVQFPPIDATLKGGVVSEHGGKAFAHLVYERGGHTIYMFEVDQAAINDNVADLGASVTDDIEHSRWHWEEQPQTGTMFAWKSNNVVCVAVSDLRTDEFSALFDLQEL